MVHKEMTVRSKPQNYTVLTDKKDIPEASFLPNTYVKAPYGECHLTFEDSTFNERLSICRKTVECTFGILYSKWRLMSKCIETDV